MLARRHGAHELAEDSPGMGVAFRRAYDADLAVAVRRELRLERPREHFLVFPVVVPEDLGDFFLVFRAEFDMVLFSCLFHAAFFLSEGVEGVSVVTMLPARPFWNASSMRTSTILPNRRGFAFA